MQDAEKVIKEMKDIPMDTIELITRFGINFVALFILVRIIYYPTHKNKDFLFTFFIFNFIIFTLLCTTHIKQGIAFGLFAIFSIMRYRTVTIPIKEMGYFFICLALGMINSLSILFIFLEKEIILNHMNHYIHKTYQFLLELLF
jgi:hypothetical protein